MEIITKSPKETFELGFKIGTNLKGGEIICLIGEMGAGKTVLVQGIAKGMKIKNKIVSPTFILMRTYRNKLNLYHLDLYRLEGDIERQVMDLGLFDIWGKKDNVVIIEWAEKMIHIPKDAISIDIEHNRENERKITSNETLY